MFPQSVRPWLSSFKEGLAASTSSITTLLKGRLHMVRWLVISIVIIGIVSQLTLVFKVDSDSATSFIQRIPPITITIGSKQLPAQSDQLDVGYTSKPSLDELMEMPLYERLLTVFPYSRSTGSLEDPLDMNIIQTDKSKDSTNKEIEKWKSNENDGFNYTMYDDQMAYRLLLQMFGREFPEIIEVYNAFPRVILKVDFFRYASMFLKGGTYSDSDTDPIKPLKEWITYNETIYGGKNTVGVVVGIESDCDCQDWEKLYSSRVQMCQWTLQSRKHHPMFAMLMTNIVKLMSSSYDQRTKTLSFQDAKYDFSKGSEEYYQGIMHLTGPGMFSNSVFQYINSIGNVTSINPNDQEDTFLNLRHPDPDLKYNSNRDPRWSQFGWENVTQIKEPVLVDDELLILPEHYFNGKKEEHEECLVQHSFHGSWKSSKVGVVDS